MSFTDQQLTKWAVDYEKELCAKHDLICDRLSLEIISGTAEYELPNYITNLRAVLYKGKEVHPKGYRASIMTGDVPQNSAGGSPYEYVVSGKGLRVIQFKPTPEENVSLYVGDLFTIEADRAGCILEYYRTPSTIDEKLRLPSWIRRYLLKDYVCYKAFNNEGPQQDIRAALYYQAKMGINEQYMLEIKENMTRGYINILSAEDKYGRGRKPAHPVLPSQFGTRVNY